MTREDLLKKQLELQSIPYNEESVDAGNGHLMLYSMDKFGYGPDHCEYFVLRVVDESTNHIVAMSYTPQPDVEAEREFRQDYLMAQLD